MTDRAKSTITVYGSIIACILAAVLMLHNSFESNAMRIDLKMVELRLGKQSPTIHRMGTLRNEVRARANKLQIAALLFAIALAVVTPILVSSGIGARVMALVSFSSAVSGAYFLATAII